MIYIGRKKQTGVYLNRVKYAKGYLNRVLVFDADGLPENQPATIGDIEIRVGGGTTTKITLEHFTSHANPPYNDPENDLIDAIRIDKIYPDNNGTFLYKGSPVVTNQIITREDIQAGHLVHQGVNPDDYKTDGLSFSLRDEGSGKWIS